MSRTPKSAKRFAVSSNQSSLLSFFQKVPKPEDGPSGPAVVRTEDALESESTGDVVDVTPVKTPASATPKSAKRRRVIMSSDDDEEEDSENMNLSFDQSPPKKKPSTINLPRTPLASSRKLIPSLKPQFQTFPQTPSTEPVESTLDVDFVHLTFDFLKPDKVMDSKRRKPNDLDYDPRTLFVPEYFLKEQSPGHRQWWRLKSAYFDTILFFKVGKFYELYHMDAVVAVEALGITYMKGKYAHCGFPEAGYAKFAEQLIAMGHRVARVEQTETPDQLAERSKTEKVKDKVVRRELCQISSVATRTYGAMDSAEHTQFENAYLMTITEQAVFTEDSQQETRFGICLVDCTIGEFMVCVFRPAYNFVQMTDFTDDSSLSSLRTLLAHYQPSEIVHPRGHISSRVQSVLTAVLGPIPNQALTPKKEFLSGEETLKQLMALKYLGPDISKWSVSIQKMILDKDEAIPRPDPDSELALSALGGTLTALARCLIDVDLVTMNKFTTIKPTTLGFKNTPTPRPNWSHRLMVLDSYALNALHILPPNDPLRRQPQPQQLEAAAAENLPSYSLFATVNHCVTPFGKRRLRQWLCAPTCDPTDIAVRQQAVSFLTVPEGTPLLLQATEALKKVPDLERLFQSIHVSGLKYRSTEHPDSRAQMFESKKYGSKKVKTLCLALDGMQQIVNLLEYYNTKKDDFDSPSLVDRCLGADHAATRVDLTTFREMIGNKEKALSVGRIVPERGMDADFDNSLKAINNAKQALDEFLKREQKKHRCTQIKYMNAVKTPYWLEIPEEICKNLDGSYELKAKKKGWNRYVTPELASLTADLEEAQRTSTDFNDDYTRRVFAKFDEMKDRWTQILNGIATFDCLMSLAVYSNQAGVHMCTPEFDFAAHKPVIEIEAGYHPCLATGPFSASQTAEFIPNNTTLGGDKAPLLLLTGANMGGKSTLMRQVAILTILAQLGGKVPARSMRLSPVDRVFCRIGASDCVAAGQSTFYTELNETNIILRLASPHSLAIVDELGRGTSTYDGTAIAGAVLRYMADQVGCRTIFSTHYHTLCNLVKNDPNVAQGHMACVVEKDELDGDPCMDNVTFLYQLASGHSSKSYGFFTAKMAGVDSEVIRRANRASQMIFNEVDAVKKLNELKLAVKDGADDSQLLEMVGLVY